MDPILDKARGAQNALERIANMIPGFSGYRERDLRRTADGLQRDFIASRLEETKKPLNDLAQGASRSGALDVINDIETARKRLDKVAARIRYADRGYSGFFDVVKVDEHTLGRVYEFDLGLLQNVDAVAASAQEAAKTPTNLKGALQSLVGVVDALDAKLGEREALLRAIQ
jgi:hypothetical protein